MDDSVTKVVSDQVRRKDRNLLTRYQSEIELPNCLNAELDDIGEKLPLYDESMAGKDNLSICHHNPGTEFVSRYQNLTLLTENIHGVAIFTQSGGLMARRGYCGRFLFSDLN